MNAVASKLGPDLHEVIAREMRGAILTLPREEAPQAAPHDSDAEQVILCALLLGHSSAEHVKGLQPRHFYSAFNARLFELLTSTKERDLQLLADRLGILGPVVPELELIRDASVFVCASMLHLEVAKVLERWLERQLIRTMQEIDAALRVGSLTHDGARARLRQHFMENAG